MSRINNALYDALGERWYRAKDDPVALLRAESRLRNPWVFSEIQKTFLGVRVRALDIGCGGGFLSNVLAEKGLEHGWSVTGVDLSKESLDVAKGCDTTRSVRYLEADARKLPFEAASFDVVCAMDFLEHVEDPARVVAEAARVLKPGGLFFFHTFNRNWLSRLVVIKGVEWFIKNTPEHLHVYGLFIRPDELVRMCRERGLIVRGLRGMRPMFSRAFFKMLRTGEVPDDFCFRFTSSTAVAYLGVAVQAGVL